MSSQFLIGLVGLMWLAGCQSRTANQTEAANRDTNSAVTSAPAAVAGQCYAYVSARDTIRLKLVPSGDSLTGELVYKLAEKDQNTGTLRGQMRGDTLLAQYTFQSEGTESVREVAFLKQGNTLLEGFGPVAEQQGRLVFSDRSRLTFTSTLPLTSTDCQP